MEEKYLIVNKKILPDYYDKVIEARNLISTSRAKNVSEAVKMVGISRSTYYKFKDYIFSPSNDSVGKKAVISLTLLNEKGNLSTVLNQISNVNANILTINQSIPINNEASVMLSLDISDMLINIDNLITTLNKTHGVITTKLIAFE